MLKINDIFDIEKVHYVYGLIDPRTNLPFYIGKGKKYKSGNQRYKAHLIPGYKAGGGSKRKVQRIEELRSLGLEPGVVFYYGNKTKKEALALETVLIDEYKRIKDGGILTNIKRTNSAPGMIGKKHSIETRKKYSLDRMGKTYEDRMGVEKAKEVKQEKSRRYSGSGNNNAIEWQITDPNGNTFRVKGLRHWCRINNISYMMVYHSQKGWKSVKFGQGKGGPGNGNRTS